MAVISKKRTSLILLVMFVAALCIGYFIFQSNIYSNKPASRQQTSQKQPEEKAEVKEEVAPGTVITTGASEFGSMLFDDKRQAIYIWELEESTTAECYGDCAEAWPPVLTNGEPVASGSVSKDLLGTTKRADGATQVTYNGHPLYYYAHEKPGEVKCHNVRTHGGLWWVIQPNGVRGA